jgi:hypothetical protein
MRSDRQMLTRYWDSDQYGSDDVTQEVFGDLAIAVAAESIRVAAVCDRDDRDDRLREILASIADQQISLGGGRRVDLPHLLHVAINPTIDEVRGGLRYPY